MKQEFKAGDLVYYPSKTNRIHKILEWDYSCYPIAIRDSSFLTSFTQYGVADISSDMPSIFHATPENHELLCKLYGMEFEEPTKPKSPKEVIQAMLDDGWDSVPCYVSDSDEATAIRNGIKDLIDVGRIDSWVFCIPFCNRTGKVIIDYIDGEIVTEQS